MYVFITINYGTSKLIKPWAESIRKNCSNCILILVDNYYSDEERQNVTSLANDHNIELIYSDNHGYGKSLNTALKYFKKNLSKSKENDIIFFIGNIDINFLNIPKYLPKEKNVYEPTIKEKRRNRNPFLTKLQSRYRFLYKLASRTESLLIYYIAVTFNKFLGIFPSKTWAIHGSLFCFHYLAIQKNIKIFNENSFLYAEELEFASYMEQNDVNFIKSDILVEHFPHAATIEIVRDRKNFIKIWKKSYDNWLERWNN